MSNRVSGVLGGLIGAGIVCLLGAGRPGTFEPLSLEQAEILSHMSIVHLDDGQGGTAKTIRISDVNVQIVNGTQETATTNGLGNLIVGYNEFGHRSGVDDRTGSHSVVIGSSNNHTSYGGLVAGQWNQISGPYASVSGGQQNVASSNFSAVSGGKGNLASGVSSAVSGGSSNRATGEHSSVSGGRDNIAAGSQGWVGGGRLNEASRTGASVSGGRENTADGRYSSVSGGLSNCAGGSHASVGGGYGNVAGGDASSVSGGFVLELVDDLTWGACELMPICATAE